MIANKTLLQRKFARIISIFANKASISYEEALGKFYDSKTFPLINEGIADMHCMSDDYLAEELMMEYGFKLVPNSTTPLV